MQALSSRRGAVVVIATATLATLALIGFLAEELGGRATVSPVSPVAGGAVAAAAPTVVFALGGAESVRELRVRLDGVDRTARLRRAGSRVSVRAGRLAEGVHTVEVRLASSNPFSKSVERRWQFAVDRTPPRLKVVAPARGALARRHLVVVRGSAEPGAEVRVAYRGGSGVTEAGEDGRWRVEADLPEGAAALAVTAADRAGNATKAVRRLTVDTVAPRLAVSRPAGGEVLTAHRRAAGLRRDPRRGPGAAPVHGERQRRARAADPRRGRDRRRRRRSTSTRSTARCGSTASASRWRSATCRRGATASPWPPATRPATCAGAR